MTPFKNLSANLAHVIETLQLNKSEFANRIGIDRTYLTRLINQSIIPTRPTRQLAKIASYLGVKISDLCISPHSFKGLFAHVRGLKTNSHSFCSNERAHVVLRCVRQHHQSWLPQFERHQGQYIIYSRLLTKDMEPPRNQIVTSLLSIDGISNEGITFFLVNPYLTNENYYEAYEYSGIMYPVSDYLYFFGEQRTGNYEIIFMITDASPEPVPTLLQGCITAIGVRGGKKKIGQTSIVLERQKESVPEWRDVLGTKLGWFDEADIPEKVRIRLLSLPIAAMP